jgi:cobalt-zinc-cadmium efflux system membrane fusion protein
VELACERGGAQVTLIGHNVDPDSQTVLVRAEVREAGGCLRPGQFVQVRLKLGGTEQRYRVPSSALTRSGDQALVFVREPFGFLVKQVRVVGQEDGYTIVAGGLKGDETVAVSGLAALKAAWMGLGGGE